MATSMTSVSKHRLRHDLAIKVAAVLGIEKSKIRDITIHMPHNDLFTVDVEILADKDQCDELATIMEKFTLTPRRAGDPKPEGPANTEASEWKAGPPAPPIPPGPREVKESPAKPPGPADPPVVPGHDPQG